MKMFIGLLFIATLSLSGSYSFAQQETQKQSRPKTFTNDDINTKPIEKPSKESKDAPPTKDLKETPQSANTQDFARGTIYCNNEPIRIGSSIALWDAQEKRLSVLFFKSQMTDDILRHWTENNRSPMVASDKNYFAKLELKIKSDSDQATRDNIESYFFYINCPTAQLNINRSIFTDPKRMIKDFSSFEGSLKTDGQIRFSAGESENFKLVNTSTKWEMQITAKVYVKRLN